MTPKMKVTLARIGAPPKRRRRSQNYAVQPMSINAVSLLLEAIFLKAKSLEALGRYKGSFLAYILCNTHLPEIDYLSILSYFLFRYAVNVRVYMYFLVPLEVYARYHAD